MLMIFSAQGHPRALQRHIDSCRLSTICHQRVVDNGPWRPLLANQLFLDTGNALGDIVQRDSKLAHILPYLREPSNDRSVEEVLESLGEEATDSPRARANS